MSGVGLGAAEILAQHWPADSGWFCRCGLELHFDPIAEAEHESSAVRTVEQLDALPDHAIVRSSTDGHAYEKSMLFTMAGRRWWEAGNGSPERSADIGLPALLIWHPDWAKS